LESDAFSKHSFVTVYLNTGIVAAERKPETFRPFFMLVPSNRYYKSSLYVKLHRATS